MVLSNEGLMAFLESVSCARRVSSERLARPVRLVGPVKFFMRFPIEILRYLYDFLIGHCTVREKPLAVSASVFFHQFLFLCLSVRLVSSVVSSSCMYTHMGT